MEPTITSAKLHFYLAL